MSNRDREALLGLVARISERRLADADEKLELAATSVTIATEVLQRMRSAMDRISTLHTAAGGWCTRCVEPWPCETEQAVEWGRNG